MAEVPVREICWQYDFHKYIERARSCEATGNWQGAQANAMIAQAFATAKINWGSETSSEDERLREIETDITVALWGTDTTDATAMGKALAPIIARY